jgi:ribokinase
VSSRGPGGKGGNQAVAAARLGARTWMVGCVGDDELGPGAIADLESAGVDCSLVASADDPTGIAQIMVDEAGENLIAVASGANARLDAATVERSVASVAESGMAVLANLEIPDEAVAAAARAARAAGCRFVLNPAPARALADELIALCDVITPNEHEAGALGLRSPEELLATGAGAVVVTRGGAGADLHRAGADVHHQEAFPVDVVDTTGAGDAFTATMAWALADGCALEEALRRAAGGGALATTALGARAGMADRDTLERLLGG